MLRDQISETLHLDYFDETMCRTIFLQLLDGIKQMHDKKVVHRDLKGDNIAMHKSGRIKILDFGHAEIQEN